MSVIRSQCKDDAEYLTALRDDFAGKAMQGFCVDANYTFSRAAELAYGQADAMIKARNAV